MRITEEKLEALKKFLKEIEPTIQPDVLLAQDTKFGIADRFLFEKSKPDKNNIYSNVRIFIEKFDSIIDLAKSNNNMIFNKRYVVVSYKPINDSYHFTVVRKFNQLTKESINKYLLLV